VCHCLLDPAVVSAGDEVLVVGPGPIGLLAAQVARASGGAVHLRGIARDATRLAAAQELGIETSVDGSALEPAFDVVVECSGNALGMTACLEHARRGGRYVQIGLAGRPAEVPFDEVCFRELTVTGGNASTPTSWRRALRLVESRAVDLQALVTEVVPLVEWERAFEATRSGHGVKFVLDPR
jgi:L-iditol 2-dehydrogenase